MKLRLLLALAALGLGLVAAPLSATPPQNPARRGLGDHAESDGALVLRAQRPDERAQSNFINSDLAFWGDMVVQGHYNGFRLVDVSQPKKPEEIIDYEECAPKNPTGAVPGNQGDIAIYGDILSRSWNSNTGPLGASCDGSSCRRVRGAPHLRHHEQADPDLIASVDLACGSHTQTMIPDLANDRLIVYVGSSSATCTNFDIVEIPLANPAGATSFAPSPPRSTRVTTSASSSGAR